MFSFLLHNKKYYEQTWLPLQPLQVKFGEKTSHPPTDGAWTHETLAAINRIRDVAPPFCIIVSVVSHIYCPPHGATVPLVQTLVVPGMCCMARQYKLFLFKTHNWTNNIPWMSFRTPLIVIRKYTMFYYGLFQSIKVILTYGIWLGDIITIMQH